MPLVRVSLKPAASYVNFDNILTVLAPTVAGGNIVVIKIQGPTRITCGALKALGEIIVGREANAMWSLISRGTACRTCTATTGNLPTTPATK